MENLKPLKTLHMIISFVFCSSVKCLICFFFNEIRNIIV